MTDKERVARRLAEAHYEIEEGMTQIFTLKDRAEAELVPGEPIKLLEVNENTIPSGVMPLHFGPVRSHGIDYPSVIIEVTPEEFAKIQANELKLPGEWTIGELIPRPPKVNGE